MFLAAAGIGAVLGGSGVGVLWMLARARAHHSRHPRWLMTKTGSPLMDEARPSWLHLNAGWTPWR